MKQDLILCYQDEGLKVRALYVLFFSLFKNCRINTFSTASDLLPINY